MDDTQKCPVCLQYKNTLLQLVCRHDPCLSCAAVAFTRQKKLKSYSTNVHKSITQNYQCTICQNLTNLDKQTIAELQATHSTQKQILDSSNLSSYSNGGSPRKASPKKPPAPKLPRGFIEQNDTDASVDILQTHSRKRSKSPITNQRTVTCKIHPEEGVSYYCMDCLENICAECAINGHHRGHRAKPTKKAISEIKKEYDLIAERSQKVQQVLKVKQNEMAVALEELDAQTFKYKAQISKQFDILKDSITSKQKELHTQLDDLLQRNSSLMITEAEIIRQNIETTKRFMVQLGNILKNDQITILGQFAYTQRKFTEEILKPSSKRQAGKAIGLRHPLVNQVSSFVQQLRQQLGAFRIVTTDKHRSKSRGRTPPPQESLKYSSSYRQ